MFSVPENSLHPAPSACVWGLARLRPAPSAAAGHKLTGVRMEAEVINVEETPKRRGGRPRKAPADLRSKRLNIRFTEAEYLAICEKAAAVNLTPTDYAHAELVGGDMPKSVPRANLEIYADLIKLSVNFNQLVRLANAGNNVNVDIQALRAIYSKINELRKSLIGVE